jgi:hypothetical protein
MPLELVAKYEQYFLPKNNPIQSVVDRHKRQPVDRVRNRVEELAHFPMPAGTRESLQASPDQCYVAHTRYAGHSSKLAAQSEPTEMDIDTRDDDPHLERHSVGIGYGFATASAQAIYQRRIHQ